MTPEDYSEDLLTEEKTIFPFVICVDNSMSMQKHLPILKEYLKTVIKVLKDDSYDNYLGMMNAYISIISFNKEVSDITPLTRISNYNNLFLKGSDSDKAYLSSALKQAIYLVDKARVDAARKGNKFLKPVILVFLSRLDDSDADIYLINKYAYHLSWLAEITSDPSIHLVPMSDDLSLERIGPHINEHRTINDMEDLIVNIIESAHLCDSASLEGIIARENSDKKKTEEAELMLEESGCIEYLDGKDKRLRFKTRYS